MSDQTERWTRVGVAVTARMTQKGVSQADLARMTGLSAITVRPFMLGRPTNSRPATMARIARQLGWPADAIQRILAGEDPATFDDEPPPTNGGNVVALPNRPADDVDEDQVELAALVGKLPPDKRAAIEQLVRTMLEDR